MMVEWKKLGEVSHYYRGVTYSKAQEVSTNSGGTKIFRANNINLETNTLNYDDVKEISKGVKVKDYQWLYKGDILICAGSGSKEHVGKVAYIYKSIDYAFGGFMGKIVTDKALKSRYLFHVISSFIFKKYLEVALNSTTINNLNAEIVNNFVLPIPSLQEQERIVSVLDTFTASIDNLKEQIAQRRRQYEHYRDQLLDLEGKGGVEMKTLPDISKNCDKERKPITSSKRITGSYPYYGASGIVDYVEGYIFEGDYLLISEDGANLLARTTPIAFSINGKNWVNNHAHVLQFKDKITQKFVEIYLNMISLEPWINGAAQPKLNQDNLNRIEIPIPSLAKQQRIVSILDTFEASVANLEAQLREREKQYEYYRNKLLAFE